MLLMLLHIQNDLEHVLTIWPSPLESVSHQALAWTGSTIPTTLGLLKNLETLTLRMSGWQGSLPSEVGLLQNLQRMDLALNQFNSSLPSEIGNLQNLTTLDMNSNRFTGTLPTELGGMTNLQELYLERNFFSGTFPTQLSSLVNLERLYVHETNFTGTTLEERFCDDGGTTVEIYADCLPDPDSETAEHPCSCCEYCCEAESRIDESSTSSTYSYCEFN